MTNKHNLKLSRYAIFSMIAEINGFQIVRKKDFYSPIPVVDELPDEAFSTKSNSYLNWNEKNQLELLKKLENYSKEFSEILEELKFNIENGKFGWYDAPIYYSIIRHFKPKNIIEVGAGYSTMLATLAAKKNPDTKITAIDPFVRTLRKLSLPESVNFIEKPVQQISPSFFKKLSHNDILFIDSSHVSKTGSDVNFLFLEVLPQLRKGVLIHIHDIHIPNEYSRDWIKSSHKFWNEQYLLHAFLIGNQDFEILLGNSYLGMKYPKQLARFSKSSRATEGSSFWIRKKA